MKTIKRSVFINCKRWFNKNEGVTYFSAEVSVDGELVYTEEYSYGYGNYCEHVCDVWLNKNYLQYPQHYSALALRDKGIDRYVSIVDVPRKKDLKIS